MTESYRRDKAKYVRLAGSLNPRRRGLAATSPTSDSETLHLQLLGELAAWPQPGSHAEPGIPGFRTKGLIHSGGLPIGL
jgi:hypothetical protein